MDDDNTVKIENLIRRAMIDDTSLRCVVAYQVLALAEQEEGIQIDHELRSQFLEMIEKKNFSDKYVFREGLANGVIFVQTDKTRPGPVVDNGLQTIYDNLFSSSVVANSFEVYNIYDGRAN